MSKLTPKSDLELGESKQTNRDMKGNHQPAEFQVTSVFFMKQRCGYSETLIQIQSYTI